MYVLLIVISILLFSLVIFVHELGHFVTAKIFGVKVNEFAIGMGPPLFKIQKKETLYSIRAFPIGGYCAMEGEDAVSENERAFSNKSPYKKMIIVAAGAIMNIFLAFVFMLTILSQQDLFASTIISKFSDNAVTNQYGLQIGDKIKSIDDYNIDIFTDIGFMLAINKNFNSKIIVERNNKLVTLANVHFSTRDVNGKKIIIRDFYVKPIEKNFWTLSTQAFKEMASNIRMTYASLLGLITGKFSIGEVSGPVGVISTISDAAVEGLKINFIAALNNIIMVLMLISVNLGIFNLLPLPALDGGRLVFLVVETIIGKPVNPKYEGFVHTAGMVLLLVFMLIVSVNDVFKLFFKT